MVVFVSGGTVAVPPHGSGVEVVVVPFLGGLGSTQGRSLGGEIVVVVVVVVVFFGVRLRTVSSAA